MDFPNDIVQHWKHQENGFHAAKDLPEYAYLFDVGTGKTLTLITLLRYRYFKAGRVLRTLIISPIITLENWQQEIDKFSKTPRERVIPLFGPVKRRIKQASIALDKYDGNVILITNYEAIGASTEFYDFIRKEFCPEVLVLDESHRCKTHNAKRTKRISTISDKTTFRYLLTGSFITNSPFDVYAQFRILDKGESFGRNFYNFQNKYFYDANYGRPKVNNIHIPDWKVRTGAYDEMNEKIYAKSMRALKEECIDLPEKVEKIVKVDMTPSQRKAYNEMKKHLITVIDGEAVTADIALVKLLRLAQISSGFVKTEDGKIVRLKNEREKALKELLFDICVEAKQKVIIWAVFHENYKQIREVCESLKLGYVEGHGLINTKEKFANIKSFNEDDSISVCIGHPASLGIGVNIKSASHSIWYSRDFSLERKIQAAARNYRGGSIDLHDKITEIVIQCRETIDEEIDSSLSRKIVTSEEILALVRKSF